MNLISFPLYPCIKGNPAVLDSEFHAVDSGFQVLGTGFLVRGTWIPDSNP